MEGVIKKLEDEILEVEAEEREEVRHLVEVRAAPFVLFCFVFCFFLFFCRLFSVIFMRLCARFVQTQTTISCMSLNIAPRTKTTCAHGLVKSAGVQPDGGYRANLSSRSGANNDTDDDHNDHNEHA